jgi:hypothetical protein
MCGQRSKSSLMMLSRSSSQKRWKKYLKSLLTLSMLSQKPMIKSKRNSIFWLTWMELWYHHLSQRIRILASQPSIALHFMFPFVHTFLNSSKIYRSISTSLYGHLLLSTLQSIFLRLYHMKFNVYSIKYIHKSIASWVRTKDSAWNL